MSPSSDWVSLFACPVLIAVLAGCQPKVPSETAPSTPLRPAPTDGAWLVAPAHAAAVFGATVDKTALNRSAYATTDPVYEDTDSLALRALVREPTSWRHPTYRAGDEVRVKILGFNDFHGNLSSHRTVEGRPVGGAAVLASYFNEHTRGYESRTFVAHAGDFIGASPAESALFQDEPSLAFMDLLANADCHREPMSSSCNIVSILGNHEFDDGSMELRRLRDGKQHPMGPFLGHRFEGIHYPILCANVVEAKSGEPLFPPYVVKEAGGERVGFIGAVLSGASWFLQRSGIADVVFEDEVERINRAARELEAQGVRAMVLVIHQGAKQRFSKGLPRDATAVYGELAGMLPQLHPEIDVVISGHTHSVLSALLPNSGGQPTLVTQAFHASTAFADIELAIDRRSHDIVEKSARIVSTFADSGPGLVAEPTVAALVHRVETAANRITSQVVGTALAEFPSTNGVTGESALGNLVADAQRAALHADLAMTTPAWVRGDLDVGPITYGELFAIQPFNNRLMLVELTGRQLLEVLNQQWDVTSYSRVLQLSGASFRYDPTRAKGDFVVDVRVGGKPVVLDKVYRAAINAFLAEGGEGFSALASAPRTPSAVMDLQALADYIKKRKTIAPVLDGRVTRVVGASAHVATVEG
jgi:5'-nucleotidase